jgi:hypothetical protein
MQVPSHLAAKYTAWYSHHAALPQKALKMTLTTGGDQPSTVVLVPASTEVQGLLDFLVTLKLLIPSEPTASSTTTPSREPWSPTPSASRAWTNEQPVRRAYDAAAPAAELYPRTRRPCKRRPRTSAARPCGRGLSQRRLRGSASTLTVRFDPDELAQVEAIAAFEERGKGQVVRALVRLGLLAYDALSRKKPTEVTE